MTRGRSRFAVDEMLGSLARWLRIIGYDATYQKDMDDASIIAHASREGRTLLTRDKDLARRMREGGLYIESDDLSEQLKQVLDTFDLDFKEDLTRCTLCNGELETIGPEEVGEEAPPGALASNDEFYRCKSCGKVYWRGSHWDNILGRLDSINSSR